MAIKTTKTEAEAGRYRWVVPLAGTQRSIPIHQIPPHALFDSLNTVIDQESLAARPGITSFAATVLTGRPTGMFGSGILASGAFQEDAFQEDAFQLSTSIPNTLLIVGTTQRIYVLYEDIFNDITGTALNADKANLARFTGIQIGTPAQLFVLHTNGVDPVKQWNSTDATFIDVAGSPPLFTDITTIDDRVVGIIPPFDVRWSPVLTLDSWPSANGRVLADTRDPLIGITNFGLNGGVAYKAHSIWNIVVTGSGVESTALRFDFRREVSGPASPAAIVNAGAHYYMTRQGRVGRWDFFNHSWVADGVWRLIQADLDTAFTAHIHGAWNPVLDCVTFYYPRIGDAGECKGSVTIMIPNAMKGITDFIAFPGRLEKAVSASGDSRLDLNKQFVATSSTPKVYTVEGANDDTVNFTGFFQTGLAEVPQTQP